MKQQDVFMYQKFLENMSQQILMIHQLLYYIFFALGKAPLFLWSWGGGWRKEKEEWGEDIIFFEVLCYLWESFGFFWNLLNSFWFFWNFFGLLMKLFESFRIPWNLLVSFGIFWVTLESFGIFRDLLDYFRIFWILGDY